jgi:hypothetical protein
MRRINLILIVSILFLIVVGSLFFVFYEDKKTNETINVSEVIENYSQLVEGISYRGGTYLNFTHSIYERCLNPDEMKIILDIKKYNTSEKIMNFVNEEFEIFEGDRDMRSPFEVYVSRSGTEYELLRMIVNMLLENGYSGVYFIYEVDGKYHAVINFRDIEEPKYYYFEGGELKMAHHGWSFRELILSEEERNGFVIDRFGVVGETKIIENKNLNILNVSEWGDREEWVN